MIDAGPAILYGLIASGFALSALFRVIAREREHAAKRMRMRAAPNQIIDNEPVTLVGTVKLIGEPLAAPLSGKPCVAYRVAVRTYTSYGRRRRIQDHVFVSAMRPFVLVTKTGDVLVDGKDCDLLLRPAPIIPRDVAREEQLIERLELAGSVSHAGFDEARVAAGMNVAVYGIAREEVAADGGGETGFREAPKRIRLAGDDTHPLTIDRT